MSTCSQHSSQTVPLDSHAYVSGAFEVVYEAAARASGTRPPLSIRPGVSGDHVHVRFLADDAERAAALVAAAESLATVIR